MSENLVTIEDLDHLDTADLRAVLAQVETRQAAAAFIGLEPGLKRRLLSRLNQPAARTIDTLFSQPESEPLSADFVLAAREQVVDVLCRLARHGQIAFDHPEDILDMVA